MTPRQRVELLYAHYPQPRTLEEDEGLHRSAGVVIDNHACFLMARAVCTTAPMQAILAPHVSFARCDQDGWLIWAFAGDISEMLTAAPYDLTWVGWVRRHRPIKWYLCEQALKRVFKVAMWQHMTRG
jgi:hypothetical protein